MRSRDRTPRPRQLGDYRVRRLPSGVAPPAPVPAATLAEETLIVLALSLLASAVFAIISLATAPVRGISVVATNQSPVFASQLAQFVFGLAPVWLVFYLVRRNGEGLAAIGLAFD